MLTNILESRDRRITNIVKLGDLLGRSLRENVDLFSINGNTVNYLTESGKVIQGVFDDSKDLALRNIKIESDKIFSDAKAFDTVVKDQVKKFVSEVVSDNYIKSNSSFDDVLSLWETRSHYERVVRRLQEKKEKIGAYNILSSDEFQKLTEVKDSLVKFLADNKASILKYQDIRNAINLSRTVAGAFNLPRLTVEKLQESKTFSAPKYTEKTVYDIICKQELIKKELIESKRDFDDVWATNEKVSNLLTEIYSKDADSLATKIEEIIVEIPYFAIASTKQLKDIFTNAVSINESLTIPDKDITSFVTRIFEMKKPYKELFIQVLNEKYGINVLNLKDAPSFANLTDTQVVIFEALSKLITKNTVLKQVLVETSKFLKGKAGVESIDVNDFLFEVFEAAGLSDDLTEGSMTSYIDFNKVAADLGAIGDVLKSLMGVPQGGMPNPQMGAPAANPAMGMNGGGPANQMPDKQALPPQEEMYPSDETIPTGHPEPDGDEMSPSPTMGGPKPGQAAQAAKAEIGQEVGMDQQMGQEDEMAPGLQEMPQEQLVSQVQEIEAILNNLKSELGMGNEMGGDGMENPEMGDEPHMNGDTGEIPVEGEVDSVEDELGGGAPVQDEEGEEESEGPPVKKGKDDKKGGFPPKKKDKKDKPSKE